MASKLGTAEVAALRSDLADLFEPADKTFAVTAAHAPVQPAGVVLAGEISEGSAGPSLRIEVPMLRQGTVEIASRTEEQTRASPRHSKGRMDRRPKADAFAVRKVRVVEKQRLLGRNLVGARWQGVLPIPGSCPL